MVPDGCTNDCDPNSSTINIESDRVANRITDQCITNQCCNPTTDRYAAYLYADNVTHNGVSQQLHTY